MNLVPLNQVLVGDCFSIPSDVPNQEQPHWRSCTISDLIPNLLFQTCGDFSYTGLNFRCVRCRILNSGRMEYINLHELTLVFLRPERCHSMEQVDE
jgi:hypothetical protein